MLKRLGSEGVSASSRCDRCGQLHNSDRGNGLCDKCFDNVLRHVQDVLLQSGDLNEARTREVIQQAIDEALARR